MGHGAAQREELEVTGPGGPAGGRSRHHGVRGSAALVTRPVAPGAIAAEALEPGEMRRLPFGDELLGAARVRSRFVPIPLDAFDEAAPGLAPEGQAAYLHLLRLSYGEGRNYCRAAKRELLARLHVSERRLLRILDALVAGGLVRPLHRDNRGTLWRVYLPREAAGRSVGDAVLLGRPSDLPAAPPDDLHEIGGGGASGKGGVHEAPRQPASVDLRALASSLAAARGEGGPEALARAEAEVRELLAEGQSPARIAAAIQTVGRRAARPSGSEGGSP
jgi:hypothetical protein